jgi:PAS domain S-box-containing protein
MNASLKDLAQELLEGRPDSLLRRALEHWPGPALLFDALLRLRWCSAAARAQGLSRSGSLEDAGFEDLELPWPLLAEDFDAALAGREVDIDAATLAARDGRPHDVSVRLRPLALGEDANGVLCFAEPATAAAPAGVPLLSPQHSLDAAQAGAWRWDFERGECVIDSHWCRTLQLDACAGPDHQTCWERQIHPDDVVAYRRRRADLERGNTERFEAEYRMLTSEHRWVWVLQRGRITRRDAHGRVVEAAGVCIDIDRRKREETQLRANESRLGTALWGARAAFWQWHVPTDVLTLSPMWFAMTQYTREVWESVRDPWTSRAHPDDLAAVNAAVQRYQEGKSEALEYEYRMRTGTGEWKWLLDRGRAVEWDPDGRPAVVMGVTLDIDAQKRAELALRSSEARLKTAVWGARMGLWETDFSTDSTVWFNDWCAQNDIEPCDGPDHVERWDANIHRDDIEEAARRFSEHVAGHTEYYDAEYRVRTRSGRWLWVFERSLVVERDAAGKALRMVGICMDISARRDEELKQHFTQPWLELALEVGRGGMWSWDLDSGQLSFTDTYYRLLGIEPAEGRAKAQFWDDCIHPEDLARVRECARTLIDGGPGVFDVEYRMRHADGRWIWIHDRAQVQARGSDGGARQVVGFVVDVSESHAAREALRASEERFRHAARAARSVIYDVDYLTSRVTRFGTASLLGFDDAEVGLMRGDWVARIHPDDAPRFMALRRKPCSPGETQEMVYRMRHRDGHWVYCWDRAITVAVGTDGQALRRIGFVQDITEMHREREAFVAQSGLLARLDVGVAVFDATLALRSANAVFAARFGAPAAALAGRGLQSLLAADEARWQRICDEMAAVNETTDTTFELPCRHCDGSAFPCQVLLRAQHVDGERQIVMTLRASAGAARH